MISLLGLDYVCYFHKSLVCHVEVPFKIFTTIFKSKVQVKTTAISVLTSFSPCSHAIPCLLRLNADLGTQQLYPKKGEQRGLDRGREREGGLVGGKKERDMCDGAYFS